MLTFKKRYAYAYLAIMAAAIVGIADCAHYLKII